ncbi:MAG: AAA family ATPase [SAR202 cluster bacterium]|nr:AAA family ATPase [SAR202 cluster bacterium]
MEKQTFNDLKAIETRLPDWIIQSIPEQQNINELLEIVMDLGRPPEARFLHSSHQLGKKEITTNDINHVIENISEFGNDNRAGIERTLHRISAIKNRNEKIVGLTIRIGRAVFGTINIIEDLIMTGKSLLLLGPPGVGKTTMLREIARVLSDTGNKRVVIVDTSNEIAGDGDIPHPSIGRSRRMQVKTPEKQHSVMIEAVENHMPEVIIIDEIGTELEAEASRTIAERGVQLVATAHGNTLHNLILNPTLSDLIGGIETVTLGDIEARRRGSQKTVLERTSQPTFEILIEIQSWNELIIHENVAAVVDTLLRGNKYTPELRKINESGAIETTKPTIDKETTQNIVTKSNKFSFNSVSDNKNDDVSLKKIKILPYGVNKGKLEQCILNSYGPFKLVATMEESDLIVTTKHFYKRKTKALAEAEKKEKPVYVLRKNTSIQIQQFLNAILRNKNIKKPSGQSDLALKDVENGVSKIENGFSKVELNPQGSHIRKLQHELIKKQGLLSASAGNEPNRKVIIYNS